MTALYRTEASNTDGGDGTSRVTDGLAVRVSSPLAVDFDATACNPEQLLALAWVTCLNATAQAVVAGARRTAVRAEVELHRAEQGGYEFRVDAFLSVEDADEAESARVLADAHSRCPVSRLLKDAATVHVHAEPYTVDDLRS